MLLDTARFGRLQCSAGQTLLFPEGLIGFEQLQAWVLLDEPPLHWLQSAEDPQIALPVVSPFLFVPDYCLHLAAGDKAALPWDSQRPALVLAVVGRQQSQWTMNLRAPLLVQPELRLGRQVVTADEQPLRHVLPRLAGTLRKSA